VNHSAPRVILNIGAPIAHLALVNPPLNVIDVAMMGELAAALSEIEPRTDISAIVIRGAGKCFSAGVDVAAHAPDLWRKCLASFTS
jgi:enoyl-CoA hydratase/carnithine racemase